MFKYRNVMIASFTLFFFSTMVHLIYSCLTLPKNEIIISLLCGGVLFVAPVIFMLIGKLRRTQPYVLVTFYAASSFALSVINNSLSYLPELFAAAIVLCGFFLSTKLCLYYLMLSDVFLITNVVFFLPDDEEHLFFVYLIICVCYNISGFGMTLFVQAMRNDLNFLRKQNKKLSLSNRQNDEFWAASSERMNNIAEKLSDTCGSLLARTDVSAPVREKLFKLHSLTGRLSIALNDAEDYALMESGYMSLNKEPYSFHSLVSDVANFCFAACSRSADLDIIIDCQPDIPSVLIGDSRRITQVIMNLFGNSVKFTEKGSITVRFSARKTDRGVNLHIEVTDTGLGITPEAANKIFTVYAENNKEKPVVHLGLGVAKKLVTLMGGFIYVRNVKTGGSRFVVTLFQEVENPLPFAAVHSHEKIHVLLYLKSPAIANACLKQLQKMGIECSLCRSRADFILKKDDSEITHIFFDYGFYPFDKPIFDIMARVKSIVAVCGDGETEAPLPRNVKRVLKPLNIAIFSHIFNKGPADSTGFVQEFIAPDARVLAVGEEWEQLRKCLETYKIKLNCTDESNIPDELLKNNYDLIFLCNVHQSTPARIMCYNDGMFMNIPTVSVGGITDGTEGTENTQNTERIGGCSDSLPQGFTPYQLNEILTKWLPDNLIKPITFNSARSLYEELDPLRGIAAAGGSKSAYRDMLEIFEDRANESFRTFGGYIAVSDFERCTIHLHSLQSAAASIGAVSVAEIIRQAESAAKRKEQNLLKELNDVLNTKLSRLLSDISQYFADNGTGELTHYQISQSAEQAGEALSRERPEIAAQIIEGILENHIGYNPRSILKSALNEINSGSYERAQTDLDKLKSDNLKAVQSENGTSRKEGGADD